MKYLKVFTDFSSSLNPLGDAECGRLFKAMLEYARTGQEPDLRGNERFIWPTAKQSIDRDADTYSRKVDAAQKATEARKRNDNERKRNDNDTERYVIVQDKDKDKDKDKCFPSYEEKHKGASALDAALNDFAEMRKKIRKPLTDRALALTLSELEKLAPGDDEKKIAILNQSIQRGWQGVFPLKDEPEATKKTAPARMPHGDDLDRLARMLGIENSERS